MKQILRLGDSYARKATPDNKHKRKHIGRAPLGLRSSSARSPLRLDTRSAPGPYLMRTGSAISSLVLRCSSACSSVLLRCFSAAPPLLERRTYGKQVGNRWKTNVSTTPQVSSGYCAGNGNQRSGNGSEAGKARGRVRDGSLKAPYTLAVCRRAARGFGLETPLSTSNDMAGIRQDNPKGMRSFPDTGIPMVDAHGMPCAGPPSVALPSLPIRMCPAYVSLKCPKGGTLAKVWRINSGRKGHGEDIGYDNDFSCVQTPAKAPALPGLGLAMGVWVMLLLAVGIRAHAQQAHLDSIRPLQIGDTIPEALWHLPLQVVNHPDGKDTITLNDYRDKKLIILDFWATWCKPCIESVIKLDAITETLGDEGAVLLPVQVYDVEKRATDFLEKMQWQLPTVVNDTLLNKVAFYNYLTGFGVVWIRGGRLLAVPRAQDVTLDNVGKALRNQPFTIENRKGYPLLNQSQTL